MSALDDFFADTQAEYDALPPQPKRTLKQRIRTAVIDVRYRLARWIDPY